MNDKEGRKWLLQKLYNNGFGYVFYSVGLGAYFVTKQQPKTENKRTYIGGDFERIDLLSGLLPDFNEPNYLDIGKYLGITDWSKVAVDTPIFVKYDGQYIHRHFAHYKDNRVYFYPDGKTSWTAISKDWTNPICVRLTGGDDEN